MIRFLFTRIFIYISMDATTLCYMLILCHCHDDIMAWTRATHSLQWRHNGRDGVSNHQPHDCLFNRLFRCKSRKTSKLRFTGLCGGNSPVTGEFPAQRASNAENVFTWWRHHVCAGNSQVASPFSSTKSHWCKALAFSLLLAPERCWANSRVTLMLIWRHHNVH